MAEQALVADLRIGLDKFNADLQKAQSAADRATANIRKSVDKIGSGAGPAANEIQKVNTELDRTTQASNRTAQATGKAFQKISSDAGPAANAIQKVSTGLDQTTQASNRTAQASGKALQKIGSDAGPAANAIQKVSTGLDQATQAANRTEQAAGKALENVGSDAGPAANEIQKVSTKLDQATQAANRTEQAAGKALENVGSDAGPAANAIQKVSTGLDQATQAANKTEQAAGKALENVGSDALPAANAIQKVSTELDQTTQAASRTAQATGNALDNVRSDAAPAASEIQKVATKLDQASQAASRTAQATGNALDNVRSDAAPAANEIQKVSTKLDQTTQAASRTAQATGNALENVRSDAGPVASEIQKVNTKLDQAAQAANRTAQAVGQGLNPALQTMKGVMGALGIDVSARALVQFAASAIKAAESLDGVERQLTMLRGSSKAAAAEMAFVRAETDRLALSNLDGAKAYARLANAAKGTKLDGEALKFVFQGVNEAVRATGMSADEYTRILNQLTQTMAKGRFQGEELTALAENGIPAYQKLADAMGITTKQLSKMLQAGAVTSENLLLLADQLHKDYSKLAEDASNTIPAQFTRGFNTIKNEFTDLVRGVFASSEAIKLIKFESNMLDIFPDVGAITQTTSNIIKIVVTVTELISLYFKRVGENVAAVFQGIAGFVGKLLPNLSSFFDKFASWSTKLGQALGFVSKDIDVISLSTEDLQKSILGITSIKGVGDVMAPFTGSEGKALVQDVRHLADEIAKLFGAEMPVIVDPKKQMDAAKNTSKQIPPEVQKLIDEIRAKIGPSLIVDPEKEKKAVKELHDSFLSILDRTNKERMQYNEDVISAENAMARTIIDIREKLEGDTRKEAEKTHDEFLRILDRTNKERIAETEKASGEITEIFENMQENIQGALAGSIRDAITGDLDSIEDFADTLTDLFTETAANIASEFLAAFAIEPIMAQVKNGIALLQGQAQQQVQQGGGTGGIGGIGGTVGTVVGGVGAGVGVGFGVAGMAGGGRTGGIVGGAVGGAVTGGTIGLLAGPAGAAIGAAAGAVIGGIVGGLMSENDEKIRLILQTSLGAPTGPHEGPTSRGPFGIVSLFDQSVVSQEVASSAAMAIAEIDAGIAQYLDTQQRAIVENYFQTAVPEGSTVQAEQMDDAIAKAIQLRLFHALTALTDQATATNIVGDPFSATAGDIQAIQQRAMEALAILKMIEEFKVGPLTETAAAIKGINDQFQQLADRAAMLNMPTDEIFAERDRLIAEITTDFNQGVAESILAIKDPIAAEFAALEAMQQERMQNAIDANADLAAVEELNALERIELEKRLAQEGTKIIEDAHQQQMDAARAGIVGMTLSITDPFGAAMHQIHQQVIAFEAQVAQGLIPQHLVDEYQRAAIAQAEAAEQARLQAMADATADFNQGITQSILSILDPVAAEFAALEAMQQERMQNAIDAGANLVEVERLNAAERIELEKQVNEEILAQQMAARGNIVGLILGMTDPFAAAMHSINQQLLVFQAQAAEGLIPQHLIDEWYRNASEAAQKAEDDRKRAEVDALAEFNRDITSDLLAITDPIAAQWDDLARRQEAQREEAERRGADLAALDALHAEQRMDLARRLEAEKADAAIRSNNLINNSIISGAQHAASVASGAFAGAANAAASILGSIRGQAEQAARMLNAAVQRPSIPRAPASGYGARTPASASSGRTPVSTGGGYGGSGSASRIASQSAVRVNTRELLSRASTPRSGYGDGSSRSGYGSARPATISNNRNSSSSGGSRSSGGGGGGGDGGAAQRKADAQRQAEQRRADAERKRQEAEEKRRRAAEAKANIQGLILDFTDPLQAGMRRVNEQVADFRQQAKEGLIPTSLVNQYAKLAMARAKQEVAQRKADARANIQGQIYDFTNPFAAAMQNVNEQVADFRQQAKEGLIPTSLVDQFAELATAEVKKQEAERQRDLAEDRRQQQIQFGQTLLQFVNPALATMIDINEQVREFQELVGKGLVPQSRIDQFKRLSLATAQIDRALEAISGGSSSNIEQVGDAFKAFIDAGLPEKSETIQRMQALTDQVAGLIEAAELLGLSTEDLTTSFTAQADIIRQDAITAIEESFQPRRDALKNVDDYLRQSRVADVLPAQQRLNEARTQFLEAVRGGDISEALQAGRQFTDIAQQTRGGTAGAMAARNEVEQVLVNMRDREARMIEIERANLVREESRQIEQVQLSRNSVDYLRQISSNNSTTALGINEMIRIARSQTAEMVETRKLLTRVIAQLKA